jgi:hypothetical protein
MRYLRFGLITAAVLTLHVFLGYQLAMSMRGC